MDTEYDLEFELVARKLKKEEKKMEKSGQRYLAEEEALAKYM